MTFLLVVEFSGLIVCVRARRSPEQKKEMHPSLLTIQRAFTTRAVLTFCVCLNAESGHQVNAELWPSALSSAIPHIIKLLDDVLVDSNKTAG